jgi:hypothetical protein
LHYSKPRGFVEPSARSFYAKCAKGRPCECVRKFVMSGLIFISALDKNETGKQFQRVTLVPGNEVFVIDLIYGQRKCGDHAPVCFSAHQSEF